MKTHDIRSIPTEELARRVENLRAEYWSLVDAVRLGKERNHALLRQKRAEIARALSILCEVR